MLLPRACIKTGTLAPNVRLRKAAGNEDPVALIGCVDPVKNCCAVGPKCQDVHCDVVLFFHKLG